MHFSPLEASPCKIRNIHRHRSKILVEIGFGGAVGPRGSLEFQFANVATTAAG